MEKMMQAARNSLEVYALLHWPGMRIAPHHELIINKLHSVADGRCKRLIITMPPRHGKTLLASHYFPAWWLGNKPSTYVIAATYAQEYADDNGRAVRNLMLDPIHAAVFPKSQLSHDSSAVHRFMTTLKGCYFAVGTGGPITGRGAHLLLIDDPIKGRQDADSEIIREKMKSWYGAVARTRLMPGGAIIIIQTRWHEDDLAGYVMKEHAHEGWELLNLPAIAESGDPLGRKEGEALWPEAYPVEELDILKRSLGTRDWTSLYQQRPAPVAGGIFQLSWWKRFRELPNGKNFILQSWDTAFKAGKKNDWSCCTTWMQTQTGYYLLDLWRGRVEYPELKRAVKDIAAKWSPYQIIVEDKASGQSVVQELNRDTRLPIKGVLITEGDKVTRANLVSPLVEAGHVFIPDSAVWLADFLTETATFPNGAHDDQVDSMSQALDWLSNKRKRRVTGAKIIGG